MKNFKIGKKLFVAFGTIMLIFIATVFIAIHSMNHISANFKHFYQEPYVATTESISMRKSFQSAAKNLYALFATTDLKQVQEKMDLCQQDLDVVKNGMENLKVSFTGDHQLIEDFINIMNTSIETKEKVFTLLKSNQKETALALFQTDYIPILINARDKLTEIGDVASQSANNFYNEGVAAQRTALFILIIISAVSLVAILLFCIYIIRSITKPLIEIETAANKMADGDMSAVIAYSSKDELGVLANSMRTMMRILRTYIDNIAQVLGKMANGNMNLSIDMNYLGDFAPIKSSMQQILTALNETISQINQSSEQVESGSEQVSSGAQALSQGATEQASSVEELATTINDISVKAISKNYRKRYF